MFSNIAASIGSGITMIAVPWLLVTSRNGNEVFGYVAISMTIISFFLTPYIGYLIDKLSRKRMIVSSKAVSLLVLLLFSIIGFTGIEYDLWHYIVIYMIGSLYYTIFFPTMFALNQELFHRDQFKALNGTMEVQGQLSSMIAGAVASILLLKWDLHLILLLDICTYALAIYFFMKVPYVRNRAEKTSKVSKMKASKGIVFMRNQPAMFLFLLASFLPFIAVMLTNYLFPVYLTDVLKVEGNIYGVQSMIYGLGAMLAGVFIPLAARKFGDEETIAASVITFTIAISFIIYLPIPGYLLFMLFIAIGNSGARVARNSFMMDQIPNDIMGRVDGLLRTIGLLLRIVLLGLFTGLVSTGLLTLCFTILAGVLMAASIYVMLCWKKGFNFESILRVNIKGDEV
jgi:MFS family permease